MMVCWRNYSERIRRAINQHCGQQMKANLFILLAGLMVSGSARCEDNYFSGARLQGYCSHPDDALQNLACASYIQGLLDGFEFGSLDIYCGPADGIPIAEGRPIIQKYMRDHPEILQKQAGEAAGKAIMEAFPCKGK